MYLHKENRELFRDAILLASQKLEVSEDIVEKDYYVTLILKNLSVIEYPVVFKGGTSLSKAFHVIDRFSEDIDITFTEHVEIDDDFLKLVKEVRAHRIDMGREIAPAAPLDVNVVELVHNICDEDFYKEDYRETTLKLISDSLEYEMLKKQYKELVERIFA